MLLPTSPCHVVDEHDCIKEGDGAILQTASIRFCQAALVFTVIRFAFVYTKDSVGKEQMLSVGGTHEIQRGTIEHLQVQRQQFGVRGMSWTVSDSNKTTNPIVLHTQGELFSWRNSGRTRSGVTNEALFYWSDTIWSLRETWEIYTYSIRCPEPLKSEVNDGKVRVYPFARMTKHLSFYTRFTLEQYECDGSLTEVWDVAAKYWFTALRHWVIREPSGCLVGTIDEKVSLFSHTFDAELIAELDKMLVAHVVIFAGKPHRRRPRRR
jgi:hypothetical protein